MMKRGGAAAMALMVMSLVLLSACAAGRTESLIREKRYLREHPVEPVARYWDEVKYAEVGGQTLTLDISAPAGEGPFPCLMIIHGGGWFMHTNMVMEGMSRYITNRGYVVFNINYRMAPKTKLVEIVGDCIGALIWIKEHAAEYGGDPARLAVTGDSAGGQLTALLVTSADDPAFTPSYPGKPGADRSITCAIPTYGIYDFTDNYQARSPFYKKVIGVGYDQDPALYKLLSPIYHVRPDLAPQLIMVGDKDGLYDQNAEYVEALKKVGAPVEFEVYPGLGHAFLNNFWAPEGTNGYDRIVRFMDEQMKK